jgi:hypothetical protein
MKLKYFIKTSLAALTLASCAVVTNMIPEDKLPGPLKAVVVDLKKQQAIVEKKYTSATTLMIDAYGDLAESVGLKKQAAQLKGEANALRAGSGGLEEARKAIKRTDALRAEVMKAVAAADGKTIQSQSALQSGFRKRNESYQLRNRLLGDALLQIAEATRRFEKAAPMEKALLTTRLDPFYFMVRDHKRFKQAEQQFETNLAETRKRVPIPQLPKVVEPTPKLGLQF